MIQLGLKRLISYVLMLTNLIHKLLSFFSHILISLVLITFICMDPSLLNAIYLYIHKHKKKTYIWTETLFNLTKKHVATLKYKQCQDTKKIYKIIIILNYFIWKGLRIGVSLYCTIFWVISIGTLILTTYIIDAMVNN